MDYIIRKGIRGGKSKMTKCKICEKAISKEDLIKVSYSGGDIEIHRGCKSKFLACRPIANLGHLVLNQTQKGSAVDELRKRIKRLKYDR